MNDFKNLRQIIEPIVPVEHAGDGLLSLRFEDGTRLAFLCGPSGRLNGVTVQHGLNTPELRLSIDPRTELTAPAKHPTHIEIHSGVLKCECGHETELAECVHGGTLPGPLVGNPEQECPACGRRWWCPATADCEELPPLKQEQE